MVNVDKDLSIVPASLSDRKTETRRNTCIKDEKFHNNKKFDERYKQKDIKELLNQIYHNKCAYCEQEVMDNDGSSVEDNGRTVEHYRPKSTYWWLAYSWDNLLLCCSTCNKEKDRSFDIDGETITYENDFSIHTSAEHYNKAELPKMIHPDFENVLSLIEFNSYGKISSADARVRYTIGTCKIDRADLNEKRKTIIDDFINRVNAKKLQNKSYADELKSLLDELKDMNSNFTALRYWMIKNKERLVS